MKKKLKVNIGDIFQIPLVNNRYAYGQVIAKGKVCDWVVVFDCTSMDTTDLSVIANSQIIFLIATVLVKLEDGLWKIIGNFQIQTDIIFKQYIFGTGNEIYLMDHLGNVGAALPENQSHNYQNLSSFSPKIVETVAKAKFDGGEWFPYLNKLIYPQRT